MSAKIGPRRPGTISITDLGLTFRSAQVLRGIDLEVSSGSIVAVLGPNGSGKTTLLRVLAGVLAPRWGSVLVCDRPPGLGLAAYVPAGERMLNWRLTGRQNLEFYAHLAGVRRELRGGAIAEASGLADASALLVKRVGECSTGERRRLMLATALVRYPPVILLDEPFADLDETGRSAVEAVARRWADGGGLVLHAAPDHGKGPSPDRVVWLRQGRAEERS